MEESKIIKLPNGDFIPVPEGSKISYTKDTKITTFPNGWIIKEFNDGAKVQMMSNSLGIETQTEWTKEGVYRKSWDKDGNLTFRVVGRFHALENVSHEACYKNNRLHHIGLTFLDVQILKTMHLIKKGDNVSILVLSEKGLPKEEPVADFPKGKRLMGIRSLSDIEKLTDSRQRD